MELISWKNPASELAVAATSTALSVHSYASAILTTHTCEFYSVFISLLVLNLGPGLVAVNTKRATQEVIVFFFQFGLFLLSWLHSAMIKDGWFCKDWRLLVWWKIVQIGPIFGFVAEAASQGGRDTKTMYLSNEQREWWHTQNLNPKMSLHNKMSNCNKIGYDTVTRYVKS